MSSKKQHDKLHVVCLAEVKTLYLIQGGDESCKWVKLANNVVCI